jgi:hypothetical protein
VVKSGMPAHISPRLKAGGYFFARGLPAVRLLRELPTYKGDLFIVPPRGTTLVPEG